MTDVSASLVVAVFARPPVAGQVKTRLAATLGDVEALDVYRQLLDITLQQVVASGFPCALFAAAPSAQLAGLADQYGATLHLQQGNGLGERMIRAMAELHQQYQRVLLIGSDCPALTAHHLKQGAAALMQSAAVIGPAEDGGYWLIGSADPTLWSDPLLLNPVRFGGPEAFTMTVSCLGSCMQSRLQYHENAIAILAPLWDLDTEADYRRALSAGLLVSGSDEHGKRNQGDSMNASASLDWELVRELKDIMAEGFITLVESYERDTSSRLKEMHRALEQGDRALLRQLAHSLKGSSSNLGAVAVTGHCVDLEHNAAAAARDEIAGLLGSLESAHEQALAALKSCLDS